jgi:hypothetical protein
LQILLVSALGYALEWLAAMTSHLPNQSETIVRCYGSIVSSLGGFVKKKINLTVSFSLFYTLSTKKEMPEKKVIKKIHKMTQGINT